MLRTPHHPLFAASLILALAAQAPVARASADTPVSQRESLFVPPTHAFFATFQFGPAMEVVGDWGTQFKVGQELGYHLGGRTDGLAIGLSLEESFGNCTEGTGVSCFSFQGGPKVWYDIQILADLPIYVAPAARLAFTHVSLSAGSLVSGSFTGAGMQLSVELRAIVADRGVLFFRPVTLDMIFGASDETLARIYDDNFAMRWDLTFGGGVAF